jgi:hypothetical protein
MEVLEGERVQHSVERGNQARGEQQQKQLFPELLLVWHFLPKDHVESRSELERFGKLEEEGDRVVVTVAF